MPLRLSRFFAMTCSHTRIFYKHIGHMVNVIAMKYMHNVKAMKYMVNVIAMKYMVNVMAIIIVILAGMVVFLKWLATS